MNVDMTVSMNWRVYVRAPDFWKLPYSGCQWLTPWVTCCRRLSASSFCKILLHHGANTKEFWLMFAIVGARSPNQPGDKA